MARSAQLRLLDIAKYARLARTFVGEKTLDAFVNDEQCMLATVYALQCVSEASRFLPDDVRARAPLLPWRDIADARNVYSHGYHDLHPTRLLDTVRLHLPPLETFAREELAQLGLDPDEAS